MKWKSARPGEKRTRTKFAFWPITDDHGITHWWEDVNVEEELQHNAGVSGGMDNWVWRITRVMGRQK